MPSINAPSALHRQELETICIEKSSTKLDREEILFNDTQAWRKLTQIVKNSTTTEVEVPGNKRSRKILAKEFKRGNCGYDVKLSAAFD